MFLLSLNPEANVLERIFDTETGIYYELGKGWPPGLTRPEAEEAGKIFDRVTVRSVNAVSTHPSAAVKYEGPPALEFWMSLRKSVTS